MLNRMTIKARFIELLLLAIASFCCLYGVTENFAILKIIGTILIVAIAFLYLITGQVGSRLLLIIIAAAFGYFSRMNEYDPVTGLTQHLGDAKWSGAIMLAGFALITNAIITLFRIVMSALGKGISKKISSMDK